MSITPSKLRPVEVIPSPTRVNRHVARLRVDLQWSAPLEAVSPSLGGLELKPTEHGASFGMTLEASLNGHDGPPASSPTAGRLFAWALVAGSNGHGERRKLFEFRHAGTRRTSAVPTALFSVNRNGNGSLNVDVEDTDQRRPILRLTWLPDGGAERAPIYWASADLPQRLALRAGAYELTDVQVEIEED